MEKSSNKKTAIVIGGSSGIGCETCLRLVNRGWNVVNISRTPCKNVKVANVTADVSSGNDAVEAIKTACDKYSVSALVYSAGFSMAAPIEYAKEADYKYLFEVNFFGALKAVQAVVPAFKQKGGRIVLVGSLGGDLPISFDSFYSSSKAALEMFCRSAYSELKPYGIKVTGLLPGGTATGFTFKRKVYTDEENKAYSGKVNRAVAALANMEQGGMSPSAVAEIIYNLLITDNPPVIKTCGTKNTVFRLFSRVMPEKVTLRINERMYNQ
ncbi:MAG: SDR family NAD(P)-dependent oxidoreductase [Clostridia bacterium]|nr:SDR family NAD(P)-dependent oxidoreductase [Clostridia bacterium]